jgi:hypothetical protein
MGASVIRTYLFFDPDAEPDPGVEPIREELLIKPQRTFELAASFRSSSKLTQYSKPS